MASGEIHPVLIFALLFTGLFIAHAPLLRLPYFWDEAGYFIPAARDLLLSGSLIPHSTVSNAHPPLLMAYLAAWWKVSGFAPAVTRTAMLMVAAFCLLGIYRLAKLVSNREVAVATVLCTASYPVFFAQSSLAHLDLAAAALTIWGLVSYLQDRRFPTTAWFSLAALTKETAVLAPLALLTYEWLCPLRRRESTLQQVCLFEQRSRRRALALGVPVFALACWFGYHRWRTGYAFGNPEYVRYNLQATLHPARLLLAAIFRVWQTFGYMNMLFLSGAAALAMSFPPVIDSSDERQRIRLPVQRAFAAVIITYLLAMSLIGGAVLARYMLPVIPLVIIVCVSTLRRRIRRWRAVVAIVAFGFVIALFVNPPYGFAPEDNLAYRDYVLLHKEADGFVAQHYTNSRVLTAWPASDELTKPYLGYVKHPARVVSIDNFSLPEILRVREAESGFDVALLFSTKYEPAKPLLGDWQAWERIKTRFFGYHRDLPPQAAAELLGGIVVLEKRRGGQWIVLIDLQPAVNAIASPLY
ncbi:MAG TPA: glycosyltransferase family 39 protein [Terriglobales bacterium]|nr:glycosyltransferase family 39 protein [Terriglobales bacterium]